MTTTDRLRDLGHRARERESTPVHNCEPISKTLADLCRRVGIPAEAHERALGEQRITHYVVMISASEIADISCDDGTVYVDPTIDQFTLENWRNGTTEIALGQRKNLPKVGIYTPDAEERDVWYHRK